MVDQFNLKQLALQKNCSQAELLASLPKTEREAYLNSLSPEQAYAINYDWDFWARPKQQFPEGDWIAWLILAGRGFGKTRVGAEWVRNKAEKKLVARIALVGETVADCRKTMIEGDAGILAVSRPDFMPKYTPSTREVKWPNGVIATTYSGEEPDQLRGPSHEAAWVDEIAKHKYGADMWDNLMFGLRLGQNPQAIVTTTPRPIKIIKDLVKDPTSHVTRGTTYENLKNLASAFAKKILAKYEGTRLGRQELNAEILDDNPDALWTHALLDRHRVKVAPDLIRIVVAIDPAVSSGGDAADTGIVVAGLGVDRHGYILEDATCHETPAGWAKQAIAMYDKWRADRIIGEVNNGGEMIEYTVRSIEPRVSYKSVHASRGKMVRAEPVSALDEQGRIHHVGVFADLEDQMCDFTRDSTDKKDRMDARVWAITELMLGADDDDEDWS